MDELEKLNEENYYYCQKKGGSHKNRKAVMYLNGFFYCEECAKNLNEIIDDNKFIKIQDIKNQCEEHKKPYLMYCENCQKNVCEDCSLVEHKSLGHSFFNFENAKEYINDNILQKDSKEYEDYIIGELKELKNNMVKKLEKLIEQLNNAYSSFIEENNNIFKLKSYFVDNYLESQGFLNYNIIKNLYDFGSFKLNKLKILNNNILNEEDNKIDEYYSHLLDYLSKSLYKNESPMMKKKKKKNSFI